MSTIAPERIRMYRERAQRELGWNGLISLTATEVLALTEQVAHAAEVLRTAQQEAAESIGRPVEGTVLDVVRALISEREHGRKLLWDEGFYAGERKSLYAKTVNPYEEGTGE